MTFSHVSGGGVGWILGGGEFACSRNWMRAGVETSVLGWGFWDLAGGWDGAGMGRGSGIDRTNMPVCVCLESLNTRMEDRAGTG